MTTREKESHIKKADKFKEEGDCYLHVEMKGGKKCEMMIAGDPMAIIHAITGVLDRMGELNGVGHDVMLDILNKYSYDLYHADMIDAINEAVGDG